MDFKQLDLQRIITEFDSKLDKQQKLFYGQFQKLFEQNATIQKENAAIKKENAAIKKENAAIKKENAAIKKENVRLRDRVDTLEKQLKETQARLKAFEARMYARGRSNRISARQDDSNYRKKVDQWHNQFHSKSFTPAQIQAMKQAVGTAYSIRESYAKRRVPRPPNSYGSMKTDSLKAVHYALGRTSNRSSSHAKSNTMSHTSNATSKKSPKQKHFPRHGKSSS